MIKKIICAFLVTAMLSFVACANNNAGNTEKATEEIKATEEVTEKATQPATQAETEPATEPEKNKYVYAEDMVGKSFNEVLEEGYQYVSYITVEEDKETLFDVTMDNADSATMALIKKLDGKTVKDLIDNNIYIGYVVEENGDYTFFSKIGTVQVKFKIEGGADAVKSYDGDSATEIKDMKKLYDLKLSEVELEHITYTIKFNEPVAKDVLTDIDDIMSVDPEEAAEESTEVIDPTSPTEPEKTLETVLKNFTVSEFYYTPIPEDFLG